MPEDRLVTAYVPAAFFGLRAALLPFAVLDDPELRAALPRWVADPIVRDALYVASPALVAALPDWLRAPASPAGQDLERTVLRYLARMAGRATPFGLFATTSLGRLGGAASTTLPPQVRIASRLGLAYVEPLVDAVRARPEVAGQLRYVANGTLYPSADRLRYFERRASSDSATYALVSVEATPYLAAVLARARGGATIAALAASLVADDPELALDEATAYVELLVAEQVLTATWAPAISGAEPVAQLIARADGVPALAELRAQLDEASAALRAADAAGPGHAMPRFQAVAARLPAAGTAVDPARQICVDAFRDAPELCLPHAVTDEVLRGVEALRRLTAAPAPGEAGLDGFKARFAERYERRWVPLLEALDEESGVGLGVARRPGQTTGPLLDGVAFPAGPRGEPAFEPVHRLLLGKLEATWRTGARELVLTDDDLTAAAIATPAALPDAFGVLATLVAASAADVDAGGFRVVLKNVHGPNGAVSLGRYGHGDPALADALRAYLRAEEALAPEVVFAEIVHQPPGHQGNVSCRPRLRRFEIPVLGATSAPDDACIALDDLSVTVDHGRIVLRSHRLGREVRPRLGNVDNYAASSVGVYRFLCMLQNEPANGLRFRWGPLRRAAAALPRVVYGRCVLATALWNLDPRVVAAWAAAPADTRFAAVQQLRGAAALPRWVAPRDDDRQIPIDLDDPLAVDVMVRLLKAMPAPCLEEVYPGPDALVVRGDAGGHVHELILPFVRAAAPATPARLAAIATAPIVRRFPPGSAWLYFKLYGGPPSLDRLLTGALGDALDRIARRWFFVRYRDPEPHLRLRVHGDPAQLDREVWPILRDACTAAIDAGLAWRLVVDTYEREVERYGGPHGIALAEAMFCADSEAVLAHARRTPGHAGADLRWRLTLRGLDALLDDLGLSLDARRGVVERARDMFGAELHTTGRALDRRYRAERTAIEALLAPAHEPALVQRSRQLAPIVAELRACAERGALTTSVEAFAGSLLHMHVNRMMVDDARAHEWVVYDFLARTYRSRQARAELNPARPR